VRTAVSALPTASLDAPPTLADAAKVVIWGLAFWGGVQLAAAGLERNAIAMVVVQAGLAEWGAGRMAIPWSDPRADLPTWRAIAGRAAIGATIGGVCAAAIVMVAIGLRAAVVTTGEPAMGALLVGLLVASLGAVRDELLLRGVVLRATRLLPVGATLVACGLAAAAARFGSDGGATVALIPEALRGTALGALWVRDRGAWMPCAANAAWTWTMGPVFGGNLFDVRFARDATSGASSIVVLGVAALVACLWATGRLPRTRAPS
jgi:hypothetical protein